MAGRGARKINPEAQRLFMKYGENERRLTFVEAKHMFETEFKLAPNHAEDLIRHFDADQNNHLSLWEFAHFLNIVGYRAPEIVEHFTRLDLDKDNLLSADEIRAGLKELQTADGEPLDDKEVEFFSNTATVGDKPLQLSDFADLLARLKVYHRPTAK